MANDYKLIAEAYKKIFTENRDAARAQMKGSYNSAANQNASKGILDTIGSGVMNAIGAGPNAARFQQGVYSGKGGATIAQPTPATKGGAQSAAAASTPSTTGAVAGADNKLKTDFETATTAYLKSIGKSDTEIQTYLSQFQPAVAKASATTQQTPVARSSNPNWMSTSKGLRLNTRR